MFFEKSCCGAADAGGEIERSLWFWFLLVVVELFAFCANDVTAMSNEVTKITATTRNNENASKGKIDLRIG